MALREAVHNLIACLASLAMLVVAGRVCAPPAGIVHNLARQIIAEELANRTGREVRIGTVSGDLLTEAVVEGVQIAGPAGLAVGVDLSAPRLRVEYDLPAIVFGGRAPAAAVGVVELDGPYALITRDREGRVNLVELFRPKVPVPTPPEARFRGRVLMRRARVQYVDANPLGKDRDGLRLSTTEGEISADFSRADLTRVTVVTTITSGQARHVSGELLLGAEDGYLALEADVEGLDAARAYATFAALPELRLERGVVDGRVSYWRAPGDGAESLEGYHADLRLRQGRARIAALRGASVDFEGRAEVSPAGAAISELKAQWATTTLNAHGAVFDLKEPTLDLRFAGASGNLQRLIALLPPETARQVPAISGASRGRFSGVLSGPAARARLAVDLAVSDRMTLDQPQVGRVELTGLRAQAFVADLSKPQVRVHMTGQRVQLGQISRTLAAAGEKVWPGAVTATGINATNIEALWTGGQPLVRAQLTIDHVLTENLPMTGLRGPVYLAGATVLAPALRAELLGGEVRARGVLRSDPTEGLTLELAADAEDLDLGRADLARVGVQGPVTGRVSAQLRLSIDGGIVGGGGIVHVSEASYGDATLDKVAALFQLRGRTIRLPLVEVTDPRGQLWATGAVGLDGALDLQVAAAELDAALIAQSLAASSVAGSGYVEGRVTGVLDQPQADIRLALFAPGYEKYHASAAAMRLQGDWRNVTIHNFLAARRGMMVAGDVSLGDVQWKVPDARIAGEMTALGMDVHDLLELTGSSFDASGVGEVRAMLAGTLQAPRISGQAELAYGVIERFGISSAAIPFDLTRDELRVANARLSAQDARIIASAEVTDLRGNPQYVAVGNVSHLLLEGLAPLRERGLDLEGEVSLSQVEVRSTPQGPVGSGVLTARRIGAGLQELRDINARFTLTQGRVTLARTQFALGRGIVGGEGFYDWVQQQVRASATLASTRLGELLGMASVAAKAFDEQTESGKPPLSQALARLSHRVGGTLSGSALLAGSVAAPDARAQLSVAELTFDGKPLPEVSGGFTFDPAGRAVREIDLALRRSEQPPFAFITGDIELGGKVNLQMDASGVDLAAWREWLPRGLRLGGSALVTVVAKGATSSPVVTASFDIPNANVAGAAFDLVSVPVATVKEGSVKLDTLVFKRGDQQVEIEGLLPFSWSSPHFPRDRPMSFTLTAANTDLSFFPPLVDEVLKERQRARRERVHSTIWAGLVAKGAVNSKLELTGTLQNPVFGGSVKLQDGSVLLPGWSQPVQDAQLDISLARGAEAAAGAESGGLPTETQVRINTARARWDQVTAALTGSAGLRYFDLDRLNRNNLNLRLALASPEQKLWPGGVLRGLSGAVEVGTGADGRLRLELTDWKGRFNDGEVTLTGGSYLDGLRPADLGHNPTDIELKLASTQLSVPNMLRTGMAQAELRLANPRVGAPVALTGRGELSHAIIAPSFRGRDPSGVIYGLGRNAPAVDLDLRFGLGPDVTFVGQGVRAPLKVSDGALVVTGTGQRPRIEGQVEVVPGRVELVAGIAQVPEFSLRYALAPRPTAFTIPAELILTGDIRGTVQRVIPSAVVDGRNIGQVELTLDVSGQLPDKITVRASSDPPLTQEQVFALLGLGGLPQAGGGGLASVRDVVSQGFLSLLAVGFRQTVFEPIEAELRRTFGLEEFSVVLSFDQPLQVRLGKYVAKNLLVTYRYGARASGSRYEREVGSRWDLGLSYELPSSLRVTFALNDLGDKQLRVGRTYRFR